jgi:hypothetical protein
VEREEDDEDEDEVVDRPTDGDRAGGKILTNDDDATTTRGGTDVTVGTAKRPDNDASDARRCTGSAAARRRRADCDAREMRGLMAVVDVSADGHVDDVDDDADRSKPIQINEGVEREEDDDDEDEVVDRPTELLGDDLIAAVFANPRLCDTIIRRQRIGHWIRGCIETLDCGRAASPSTIWTPAMVGAAVQ